MNRRTPLRDRLYRIIIEHDTVGGKLFDVALIVAILFSVVIVMLDSVAQISARYGDFFYAAEWFFTILFTIEYIVRLYAARRPVRYARSFFGVVDLMSILPSYIGIIFPVSRFLLIIRVLRVLRIFRVLKLAHFLFEASTLGDALKASRFKITVFLITVLVVVMIVGSLMYLIEGAEAGFTSIPRSIYWAIVTLTTVGYGDVAPQSALGQTLAALLMITGFGIIAVPTGIVTAELTRSEASRHESRRCAACGRTGHEADARYCRHCGGLLSKEETEESD